jgi:hypothetical protein
MPFDLDVADLRGSEPWRSKPSDEQPAEARERLIAVGSLTEAPPVAAPEPTNDTPAAPMPTLGERYGFMAPLRRPQRKTQHANHPNRRPRLAKNR